MAKNSAEQASTGGLAPLLMIVAVVATVALLVWLSFASEPAQGPAMAMDDTTGVHAVAGPTAPTVTAAEFGGNIASYANQEVNLAGVMVSSVVNEHLLWVDVPAAQGTSPFLVRVLPGAVATTPAPQSTIDVEGMVLAKTDSVLSAWDQAGAIPEGNAGALQTGSWFIEARAIRQGAGSGQN
jgi:hypothetical protein